MLIPIIFSLISQCQPGEIQGRLTNREFACFELTQVVAQDEDAGVAEDVGAAVDASASDTGVADAGMADSGVVDSGVVGTVVSTRASFDKALADTSVSVINIAPGVVFDGPISVAFARSNLSIIGDLNAPAVFRTTGPCLLRDRTVPMQNVTISNVACVALTKGAPDNQPCAKVVGEAVAGSIHLSHFSCVGYGSGLIFHPKTAGDRISDVTLDNVILTDVYSTTTGQFATGVFAQAVDGLSITNSIFTRVGAGTCYDHAVYVQGDSGPATVDNSVFTSGGDVELRSGGYVRNSSFNDAPDLLYFGGGSVITEGGVRGEILNSVFTGMKDFANAYSGCGGVVKGRAIRAENVSGPLNIVGISVYGSKSSTAPILLDATLNGNVVKGVTISKSSVVSPTSVRVETRGAVDWTWAN